jgi:tetrapyrrole methylase family protein/MazG family protein
MNNITIVGMGPGDSNLLTREAYDVMNSASKLIFRTSWHQVYKEFEAMGKVVESLDDWYEEADDFDELSERIQNHIEKIAENEDVVYCVLGNPAEDDEVTLRLLNSDRTINIVSGISYVAYAMNFVSIDSKFPSKVMNVFDFSKYFYDIHSNNFITNAYDSMLLSDLVWTLEEQLGDEYEVYLFLKVGTKDEFTVNKTKLMDILNYEGYDHQTVIFIPAVPKYEKYNLGDLRELVEKLRGKDGCPWDIEQTHESVKRNLLEEAYEVIEAIENEDYANLEEELGDLLFQVVFHSQMADEEGYFGMDEVINHISRKMVYRHPHVFDEKQRDLNTDKVLEQWDKLKDSEKGIENYTERLLNVPKVLPSLLKSYKIQKKASKVGFDWDDINGPLEKLCEEIVEIKDAIENGSRDDMLEELGDVLFSVVNVSRFLNIDPEEALEKTIEKFIKRFEYIEKRSLEANMRLEDMSLDEMDKYWEESKELLN